MLITLLENKIIDINKLLIEYYPQLELSSDEFLTLLMIFNHNDLVINVGSIAKKMNKDEDFIADILSHLMEKGFIAIEFKTTDDGKFYEKFSTEGTLKKIEKIIGKTNTVEVTPFDQVVSSVENHFSRSLSFKELQIVKAWINEDLYAYDYIIECVEKTSAQGQFTIKAIEKNLRNTQVLTVAENDENLIKELFSDWKR